MITKVVCLFIALIAQLPLSESTLRIGIPDALFPSFVHRESNGNFSGLSIEVFKESLRLANISSHYEFVSFNGTYNELIKNVAQKKFDAAAGDLQILPHRFREVDFTVPYLASGIIVVVPQKLESFKTTWMLEVFTKEMWITIAVLHLLISLVTAMIELTDQDDIVDFKKLIRLWLAFLSFTERESLESDVGRYIRAVWKLVIAILVACYNSNLTSSSTVSMTPRVLDIGNAAVGCNKNSFICSNYLPDVLHVDSENIKKMSSPSEYIEAFRKSEIEAAYFIEPHARVFLKMYGQEFKEYGTPNNFISGLAFAFQKGSPYTSNMSLAISELIESGKITKLQEQMIDNLHCELQKQMIDDVELQKQMIDDVHCVKVLDDEPQRKIRPSEFLSLLMVSAVGLTIGFVIVAKRLISKRYSAVLFSYYNWLCVLSPSFKLVSNVKD